MKSKINHTFIPNILTNYNELQLTNYYELPVNYDEPITMNYQQVTSWTLGWVIDKEYKDKTYNVCEKSREIKGHGQVTHSSYYFIN